jgi:gag-polypeptide of LTR copia-type
MSQNHEKLTGVMLNGKNYHVWARQVIFALSGREKSEHIDSEDKAPKQSVPPTEPEKRALARWKVSDHTVITWLLAKIVRPQEKLCPYLPNSKRNATSKTARSTSHESIWISPKEKR